MGLLGGEEKQAFDCAGFFNKKKRSNKKFELLASQHLSSSLRTSAFNQICKPYQWLMWSNGRMLTFKVID